MPRFGLHAIPPFEGAADAVAVLAARYPEIAVVEVDLLPDGTQSWVVEAPSATHIVRWITEQHIPVDCLLDTDR